MACIRPSLAYLLPVKNEEGNSIVKFIPPRADYNINYLRERFGDDLLLLPCGKCLPCKIAKSKDWATRCYLESLEYKHSCFITLTYDDEHYPGYAKKEDFQNFIKALRNSGIKCRYFGCGEFGSHTKRFHMHLIVFGWMPGDLVFERYGSQHDKLYTSEFVSSLWQKGFVLIGEVTFLTAGYVARYTTKKLPDDGSFLLMSLKPGIGMNWIKNPKNLEFVYKYDKIPGEFGSMRFVNLPRAFDKVIKDINPDIYEELKKRRLEKARLFNLNDMNNLQVGNLEQALYYRGNILNQKLKNLERS